MPPDEYRFDLQLTPDTHPRTGKPGPASRRSSTAKQKLSAAPR